MKHLIMFIVTVLSIAMIGCPVVPQPKARFELASCTLACKNLIYLGCKQGYPIDMKNACKHDVDCVDRFGKQDTKQVCSPLGRCMVTCATFCAMAGNIDMWPDPKCVTYITNCDEFYSCTYQQKLKYNTNTCDENSCQMPHKD